MPDVVHSSFADGVAQIAIDHPPLNILGHAVCAALYDAIDRAEADPDIGAIVLTARGATWPVGIDVKDIGRPAPGPTLSDLCLRVAGCIKPVVAALHGRALGGGLELALCARFRIAAATTQFGFPDITLGLVPGAGGTPRRPRTDQPWRALRLPTRI